MKELSPTAKMILYFIVKYNRPLTTRELIYFTGKAGSTVRGAIYEELVLRGYLIGHWYGKKRVWLLNKNKEGILDELIKIAEEFGDKNIAERLKEVKEKAKENNK